MDILIYCESCRYHWSPPDHPVRPSTAVRKVGIVYTPGRGAINRSKEIFTTGVPDEFKVELVKKVRIPEDAPPVYSRLPAPSEDLERGRRRRFGEEWERWILRFFEMRGLRTHVSHEHVIATLEEVRAIFNLVPGEYVDTNYVLENSQCPNSLADTEEDSEDDDEEEDEDVALGPQMWSVTGIRQFMDEEWTGGEVYKAEDLYNRLVAYCQTHNYPYYAEKEGMTKPHLNSLGGFLRRNFVGKGLSQDRTSGNKAIYWKTMSMSRE